MRCMISDFGTCTKKLEQLIGERTGNTGTMVLIVIGDLMFVGIYCSRITSKRTWSSSKHL